MDKTIEVTFRDEKYQLRCFDLMEKDMTTGIEMPTGRMTPYCKSIEIALLDIMRKYPDVKVESESTYIDASRSIAKVRVMADGVPGAWYYGEVDIRSKSLTEKERKHPFNSAMNKALCSATMRLFGYCTKTFRVDGTPVYYPESEENSFTDADKAELESLGNVEFHTRSGKTLTIATAGKGQVEYILGLDTSESPEWRMIQDNIRKYLALKEKEARYAG